MNIYGVDAGDKREAVYEDFSVGAGHWEYYRAVYIVAARSRGQARGLVATKEGMDFTEPMIIRFLGTTPAVPGVLDSYDMHGNEMDWWYEFDKKLHPNTFDEVRWQAYMDEDATIEV